MNGLNQTMSDYPKWFQESDIVCFHPIENEWRLGKSNLELCNICKKFVEQQHELYKKLVGDKPIAENGQIRLV